MSPPSASFPIGRQVTIDADADPVTFSAQTRGPVSSVLLVALGAGADQHRCSLAWGRSLSLLTGARYHLAVTTKLALVRWQELPFDVEDLRVTMEDFESSEFDQAFRHPPAIPKNLRFASDDTTLATSIATALGYPRAQRAQTLLFVPFLGALDALEDCFDFVVDCDSLRERWGSRMDDINFALTLDTAVANVEQREGSAADRGLWLLRELAERYVPVSLRLGLPIKGECLLPPVVEAEASPTALEDMLDTALSGWGDDV